MSSRHPKIPDRLTADDVADYEARRVTLHRLGRRRGVCGCTAARWLRERGVAINPNRRPPNGGRGAR